MRKEKFELYEFKGRRVLFTSARDRHLKEPVPEGFFKYEIRHSDEGFEPCVLAKHILVNHYGTIFSNEPIDLGEEGYINFREDIDFIDLNQMMTFDEYLNIFNDLSSQQCGLEDIREYHRKVYGIENTASAKVNSLLISDPWYDQNVSCRYEKNYLNMNVLTMGLVERDYIHLKDNYQFHDSLLIIILENKNSLMKELSEKTYQIGVDTAEYRFECNGRGIDVKTMADGYFGTVIEHYYGDTAVLGLIEIELSVPDEIEISQKEFIDFILSTMGIDHYEMKVIEDTYFKQKQEENMKMTM
jgi:hypothetical protein